MRRRIPRAVSPGVDRQSGRAGPDGHRGRRRHWLGWGCRCTHPGNAEGAFASKADYRYNKPASTVDVPPV
jgi:hypothetical protein